MSLSKRRSVSSMRKQQSIQAAAPAQKQNQQNYSRIPDTPEQNDDLAKYLNTLEPLDNENKAPIPTDYNDVALANRTSLISNQYNDMENNLTLNNRDLFLSQLRDPNLGHGSTSQNLFKNQPYQRQSSRQQQTSYQEFNTLTRGASKDLSMNMQMMKPYQGPSINIDNGLTKLQSIGGPLERDFSIFSNLNNAPSLIAPPIQVNVNVESLQPRQTAFRPAPTRRDSRARRSQSPILSGRETPDRSPYGSAALRDKKAIEKTNKAVDKSVKFRQAPQTKTTGAVAQKKQTTQHLAVESQNDHTDNLSQLSKNWKGNKRGRKQTDTNKFLFESNKKIMDLKEKLKTSKGLSSDEKQKIRNQISAQKSRANKRQETMELTEKINQFKEQFKQMAKTLNTHMKCKCRENVIDDLLAKMPDTTAFEDLPELQLSSSAPNPGAQRLTRQSSRGPAGGMGLLQNQRRSTTSRANQLVKIMNCFIGFE